MASFIGFSRLLSFGINNCVKKFNSNLLSTQNSSVHRLGNTEIVRLKHYLPWFVDRVEYKPVVPNLTSEDEQLADDVIAEINKQVATEKAGRLFAVVHVCGKQFKVTTNDIIVIQGYWPPSAGDELRLEKVLLVGSSDFTLIGRPILNNELVNVEATVIEKTFSSTKTIFKFKPRKQYRRINFTREQQTMLRIKSINVIGKVGEKKEVEGLEKVF
ncbi:39S ribosomal protein L21, mitochondrial [Leptopilina boulardi]|uniref:39S ribosomal protein L21, mitochondrial n=1 Tax=Leptopilina boulardi TaxID=63433 RepID=UPI0021F5F830|nr:39S ribosomal protein L21, mitochondrial [Leptopilina boulardi]XP_051168937.1 39S ribosomal protein L21, mitochondrial [Leptopilina boulardi]